MTCVIDDSSPLGLGSHCNFCSNSVCLNLIISCTNSFKLSGSKPLMFGPFQPDCSVPPFICCNNASMFKLPFGFCDASGFIRAVSISAILAFALIPAIFIFSCNGICSVSLDRHDEEEDVVVVVVVPSDECVVLVLAVPSNSLPIDENRSCNSRSEISALQSISPNLGGLIFMSGIRYLPPKFFSRSRGLCANMFIIDCNSCMTSYGFLP
mmetsp:Transcript_58840/g.97352  ORF Transcript_58840/g.97352 Transcript_58840/m.97352 type:complete len:210 (+) Transcript_58840:187-816(+)